MFEFLLAISTFAPHPPAPHHHPLIPDNDKSEKN